MGDNGRTLSVEKTFPKVDQTLVTYWGFNPDEIREFNRRAPNPEKPSIDSVDNWQSFTLADAYKERQPVEYVVGGLFALPSLNMFYSPPGYLKTMLAQDLSIKVAAGLDWLQPLPGQAGGRSFSTRQVPVMWIDFDNGRRRTHDRFSALARACNLPETTPLTYYSMPNPWLNASNKTSIGDLINRINDHGTKLVCLDNLGVVCGDAEENGSEMASVMSHFRQMAEDTGAAIVLIHHQRKGGVNIMRSGDSLRGHSSIEASLDLALCIERDENADVVTLKATKVRGPKVLPFSAIFTYESDPENPDELLTAKFYSHPIDDLKSDSAIEREILEALSDEAKNKTALVKDVHEILPDVGINRIRQTIDKMAQNKRIFVSEGSKPNERNYRSMK